MAKRGDRRRKRLKEMRVRRPDVEGFQFGPLTMERHGRNLVTRLDTDHPDYPAFREMMDETAAQRPLERDRLREALRELFGRFNAFDVVAILWLVNSPRNPETYRESTHKGLAVIPELAASILVERNGPEGTDSRSDFGPVANEAQALLEEYLRTQSELALDEARVRHSDDLAYGEIRGHARVHRLAVRGPSYWWQEEQTLLDLFDGEATRDLVATAFGLSVRDALALGKTTVAMGLAQLREKALEGHSFAASLLQEDARARQGEPLADQRHQDIVESLASMNRADAAKTVNRLAIAWATSSPGETFSFTVSDLAAESNVGVQEVAAFLDAFSVAFGEFTNLSRHPEVEDLRDRPLLRDATDHHLCVSPHNLLWGLRPRIEDALKKEPRLFKPYERHRAKLIERRSVAALSRGLSPDWYHEGLQYEIPGAHPHRRYEIDGLIRLDSVLYIIEAKASSMRPAARRGAPDALRDWLRGELSKAAAQARQARDALFATPAASVIDHRGRPLSLDLEGVHDIVEVVVTLEDLPAIAPLSWKLADAKLLPSAPVPWVVSLHELEIVCELAARPAELVHYTLRRQRMDSRRDAWAMDELDYYMHYVRDGLFWQGDRSGGPEQLLSFTDDLDAYYAHKRGERKTRARRPVQRHNKAVESLLKCLDQLDAPGRLDAALAILDVATPARERIAADLRRLKAESARDGRDHDRSYLFDDLGITVMACPRHQRQNLPKHLLAYCQVKKYQMRMDRWVGFGVFGGPPEPAQFVFVSREPWTTNENLDKLAATLPSYGVQGDFDGRKLWRGSRA